MPSAVRFTQLDSEPGTLLSLQLIQPDAHLVKLPDHRIRAVDHALPALVVVVDVHLKGRQRLAGHFAASAQALEPGHEIP
jgi:hypothetical protein